MTTLPIDPKPRYTRTPPGLPAPAWRSGSDSPSRSSMSRRNSPRPEETLHEETLHNGVVPAQRKPLSLKLPRRLMLDTIPAVPSLSWNAVLAYWLPRSLWSLWCSRPRPGRRWQSAIERASRTSSLCKLACMDPVARAQLSRRSAEKTGPKSLPGTASLQLSKRT